MIVEADGRRTQVGVFSYQFSLGYVHFFLS